MRFDDPELERALFQSHVEDLQEIADREAQERADANMEKFFIYTIVNSLLDERLTDPDRPEEVSLGGAYRRLLEYFPLQTPTSGKFKDAELAMVVSGEYKRIEQDHAVVVQPVKISLRITTLAGETIQPLAVLQSPRGDDETGIVPDYGLYEPGIIEQRLTYDVGESLQEPVSEAKLELIRSMVNEAQTLELHKRSAATA